MNSKERRAERRQRERRGVTEETAPRLSGEIRPPEPDQLQAAAAQCLEIVTKEIYGLAATRPQIWETLRSDLQLAREGDKCYLSVPLTPEAECALRKAARLTEKHPAAVLDQLLRDFQCRRIQEYYARMALERRAAWN